MSEKICSCEMEIDLYSSGIVWLERSKASKDIFYFRFNPINKELSFWTPTRYVYEKNMYISEILLCSECKNKRFTEKILKQCAMIANLSITSTKDLINFWKLHYNIVRVY